ncbi:hypothetical protein [Pseudomonas fluorescens]
MIAKLNLGIVAKGGGATEQRDYLASSGVDFPQGDLFAHLIQPPTS